MERRARGGGRSGEQLLVLAHRIIPCLDVADGRVVKGTRFVDLRDAGDPVELARRYSDEGADELVFLDISASSQRRGPMLELVERIARAIRIPFTIGGGIASADDVVSALEAGADKVSLNTAIVLHPELVTESAERAGSQAIVAAIDAKRAADRWEVWIRGGRERCYLDAVEWACELARLGAGELLVTSIDRDGSRSGYDVELLAAMAAARLPLIASGGAGELEHLRDAVTLGGADAILVASIVHDGSYGIADLKRYLLDNNITVRP